MKNVSSFTTFILINYQPLEQQKDLYFAIFLLLYVVTITFNTTLIGAIVKDKSLHEPMYIFISYLSVNAIYGSTALLPNMIIRLISQSYKISLAECATQVFFLHTFAINDLNILTIMGYDRYAAICNPFHYHNTMSPSKVKIFIAVSWLYSSCTFTMYLSLSVRLSFCRYVIPKTHCANYELVNLSCDDTSVNNIFGLISVFFYLIPQLLLILFSYIQILRVCLRASKECKRKAFQTCLPHIVTVIIYCIGMFFELSQGRLEKNAIPHGVKLFMSLYFLITSPLLNPVVYGAGVLKIYINVKFSPQR